MNEAILNLLIQLFDPGEAIERATHHPDAQGTVFSSLVDLDADDVITALEWLTAFRKSSDTVRYVKNASRTSFRIYPAEEQRKIPLEARAYIQALSQAGIMDTRMRENILHHIMGIDTHTVSLKHVKWMILLAFCHQHQFDTLAQHMNDLAEQLTLHEEQ